MSLLDAPGDLARTPLASVLLEARERRASGVLEIAHGGGTSRLWFHDGAPVGAQVFVGFRPLGHMLLKAGVIDIDTLSQSLVRMAETRRPHGEILVEMGAASRDQIERALEGSRPGTPPSSPRCRGPFAFEPSAEVPGWTHAGLLSPLRVLTDALAAGRGRPRRRDAAAGRNRRRELGAAYAGEAERGLVAEERRLVARLTSPCSLDAYLAAAEVPPERALALLARCSSSISPSSRTRRGGRRPPRRSSSRRRSPPSLRRRAVAGEAAERSRRARAGDSASSSGGCGTWSVGPFAARPRRAAPPSVRAHARRIGIREPSGSPRVRRRRARDALLAVAPRAREGSLRAARPPTAPGGTR
jgi:hypothetical protein